MTKNFKNKSSRFGCISRWLIYTCFGYSILICRTASAQLFTTVKTSEGIEISENGKKVLFYQQNPKSFQDKYNRAGYVHPLYNLNEKILTEDFPIDHPYHHGIFWAWHQIIFNNKQIADGWIGENISWQTLSVKTWKRKKGITLQSIVLWKSALQDHKTRPIVKENTHITVYEATDQYRVIDFDIYLSAMIDSLKIGGSDDMKGYGGFCMRLNLPADIAFTSADSAVTPIETAVSAGPWMDIKGSLAGADSLSKSGVAIFPNPSNPGTKQQWILRKQTSMQNVPYPGRIPVNLTKNGLRLRYRIIVHNADLNYHELDRLYEAYISNPDHDGTR